MDSGVERRIESIPQAIERKTRLIVILDCFYSWQFLLVNPIHEFLRPMTLVGDLLNFGIEKQSLGRFDHFFEQLPILKAS